MKIYNQCNHIANDADATSNKRNRLESQVHPIRLAVIAAIIALTLTGTQYLPKSPNNNAAISSLPGYKLLPWANDVGISHLAVMPFLNVNADQQLDYLSDGITEMLICNLSQLSTLNVKARASVFCYKGRHVTPHTVGTELNVQAVLNGRVVVDSDALALSLELADAQTDNIIWSEQYYRKQADLVALQSEIARDVSNKLRVKLWSTDELRLSKKYTTDPEAYQFYLEGRYYWNKRTLKDLEKALEYFDRAISLDPNFALAYAGRADTYLILPFYRNEPVGEGMLAARGDALKALSLDDDLAEPHATLGDVFVHEYDFAAAEREYQRAVYLNPNYATAHQWYGILLFYLARHEEACAELRKAIEIDPRSLIINLDYAEALFYADRYDDAIDQLNKTLELNAEFETFSQRFFRFYQANGKYREATQSYANCREFNGDRPRADLICDTLAKGGSQRCLHELTAKAQLAELSAHDAAVFLAALVEKDGQLGELNMFYEVFGASATN